MTSSTSQGGSSFVRGVLRAILTAFHASDESRFEAFPVALPCLFDYAMGRQAWVMQPPATGRDVARGRKRGEIFAWASVGSF